MDENNLLSKFHNADIVTSEDIPPDNGEISKYYIDVKKAYGNPELLTEMAKATVENLNPETTCVTAAGYGGLPLGVEVSRISGLPLSLIRNNEKNHAEHGMFDGYTPGPDDSVSIVDDVFASGGSLLDSAKIVRQTGAKIAGCHVVIARGDTDNFDLSVSYLFKPEEIAEI